MGAGNVPFRTIEGYLYDALNNPANTIRTIKCSGNPPIEYTDTTWNDLKAPFTQVRLGALLKPDFDYTNMGLLFPSGDTSEIAYLIMQFDHEYKLGTDIYPHIHWQQMNSNAVVWKFDYKWFDEGDTTPAAWTTVTATGKAFTYTSGNLAQIETFDAIDGSGISGVSSLFLAKVYRDDVVDGGAGGSDALAWEFDIHYEVDTPGGSHSQYSKS
jgi:hypothetical protein